MRLLITGGSGLLGSKTASITVRKGYETYSGYNDHEATNGTTVKLDICNKREVDKAFDRVKPDTVIHAAALTNVDKCEEDMEMARRVNIEGTQNITNASEHHNAFLVHISTDYIFSGEEGMYKETDEPNPINYYGLTKLEAEKIVTSSNLEWCIARSSVIYGATPAAGKDNFALWVLNKLKNRERMRIITDQWVSPTLNTNLAEMILEIMEKKLTGTYHLAGATPLNRHEFTTLIAETFQLDRALISPVKSSEMKWLAKRPKNTSLNVEKALKTLKNKPLKIQDALSILREETQDLEQTLRG
jgi:dTDP-4-dehydrorhamnose reductase